MKGKHGTTRIETRSIDWIDGWVCANVESFAQRLGISSDDLKYRLGVIFLGRASGIGDRTEDRVSELPEQTAKTHKATRKVEVVGSTRSDKSSLSAKIGANQKAYWAKFSDAQRAEEVARRMVVAKKNKAKSLRAEAKAKAKKKSSGVRGPYKTKAKPKPSLTDVSVAA